MRTTIQNRVPRATIQPATSMSGLQAQPRIANRRQTPIERQLNRASRLGHRFDSMDVQPPLTLGPTDDQYEREAGRVAHLVAEQITNPSAATARPTPRLTPLPRHAEGAPADGAGIVQRHAAGGHQGSSPVLGGVAAQINAARPDGQPLPTQVRAPMEQAFGFQFGDVRIHADANSHALSRRLGARAFTIGNDVFFKGGHYAPNTRRGLRLLAHELTHTLQQRHTGSRPVWIQRQDDDELEQEFGESQVHLQPKAKRPSLVKAMQEAVSSTEQGTELPGTGLGLTDVAWFAGSQGGGRSFRDYAASDPLPTSLIGSAPSLASLAAVPQEAVELGKALREAKSSWSGSNRNRWRTLRRVGTAADKGVSISGRVANAASFTGNLAWHGAKLAGDTGVATGAGNFLTVAGQVVPGIGIGTGTASVVKSSYAAHKARKRIARLQEMLDEKPHSQATSDLALERQFRDSAVGMDGKPSSPKATSDFEIESQFRDSAVDKDGKRSPVEATSDDEIEDQFQESATDLSRRQLLAYALRNQRKRANRAAVNITSSTLQTAGNIVSTAGAPAAAGVAIAAAGTGVKYGAMAARKIKQKARDVRERQGQNRSKLGQFIDKVFDPDVTRSTDKKKGERKQMTNLLISGGHHDILEQMGAKPEHIALLQKPGRTQAEEQTLRAEVKRLWKKRE